MLVSVIRDLPFLAVHVHARKKKERDVLLFLSLSNNVHLKAIIMTELAMLQSHG